jgi:hypothetical protein
MDTASVVPQRPGALFTGKGTWNVLPETRLDFQAGWSLALCIHKPLSDVSNNLDAVLKLLENAPRRCGSSPQAPTEKIGPVAELFIPWR